jgi:hypothetical protein
MGVTRTRVLFVTAKPLRKRPDKMKEMTVASNVLKGLKVAILTTVMAGSGVVANFMCLQSIDRE